MSVAKAPIATTTGALAMTTGALTTTLSSDCTAPVCVYVWFIYTVHTLTHTPHI